MHWLVKRGCSLMLMGVCLACGTGRDTVRRHPGIDQPTEEARSTASRREAPLKEMPLDASRCNGKQIIGDCSRCYVELWSPADPAVRFRLCGGISGATKEESPRTPCKDPICCEGPHCKLCPPPERETPWDGNRDWSGYILGIGPDATVDFIQSRNNERRRGPLEASLESLGMKSPFPLRISCRVHAAEGAPP